MRRMVALWLAKKKTDGAVAARPVEEPLLVAAVHDARRGAAVSTAAAPLQQEVASGWVRVRVRG